MSENRPQRLLTVREAAERLRESRFTIYRRVADGTYPAIRLHDGPNAPIRVPEAELEAFLYRGATGQLASGCRG